MDINFDGQNIVQVDISKEMKKSFLDYSMSVIVSRALPDVRDGLKPIHRRILYSMHENNLAPDKAHRKCAKIVGEVMGNYHPHGDMSIYDALVRMAQDFSLRYMMVDGKGNFGSVDGDPPAANRYTEARMSKIAVEMLTDIDKETVDFSPNYDDTNKEPQTLPSRFPNLLVNGSTGIAVGMATNIPPHNLCEVIDAVCMLIDNPEADLIEIMEHVKGPDFPTGGIIMGQAGIRAAYATGRGRVTLRARAEIEEAKNGRFKIIVTELPYQVNKARLIEAIADLVKDKRMEGISNIDDYSDRNGMRIEIDIRRDASPQVVLNQLYRFTQMQTTFGVNSLALVGGIPKTLTLKEMLTHYITFQIEVITRRTIFDLRKAKERAHVLEALKVALEHIDEVIAILKASKSVPEGKQALMERFGFDDIQATAIVQMRLGQLTGLERGKIEDELAQLAEKIADLSDILASEERKAAIVKEEIGEIRRKFGDERRTEICQVSGEVDIEDLIPVEECVMTLTRYGYIKRQPVDTYRTQRRGGRGIAGMSRREEDYAEDMFIGSTHDYVMFFTSRGRVYRLKCYEIPEGSRTSKGINIANILPVDQEEKVTAMIRVSEFEDESYLCMVTAQGIIKRTKLSIYNTSRKGGIIALDINEGDELRWVKKTSGEEELIVATRKGMAIRFKETDLRPLGRLARGVRAIRLSKDDEVVGLVRLMEGGVVLTVSETGFGRLSGFEDYRVQFRGGKGIKNYRTAQYGEVAAMRVVDKENDDIILISNDGIIIRIAAGEIRECARPAKGVRVMRVGPDAKLVAVAKVEHDEDEVDKGVVEVDGDPDEGAGGDEPEQEQAEE